MPGKYDNISANNCPHAKELRITSSKEEKCGLCSDDENLRICTSCGKVFCCESSNAHDTAHYKKTGHPIIKPVHCSYDFTWCYGCKAYLI